MNLNDYIREQRKNPDYIDVERKLQLRLNIADAILRTRLDKGWSQTQLAKQIGTKQANISRLEAGLANPTLELLEKLFAALEINWVVLPHLQPINPVQIDQPKSTNNASKSFTPESLNPCSPRIRIISRSRSAEKRIEA